MTEGAPRDLTRTVVRGAGLATAGYVITQALSLGQYLALARLATPRDFGELAAGSIVVGIGMLATESGLMSALVSRRDRIEEAAATAAVATIAGGILFSLVALALSPAVGLFFHSARVEHVAMVMSAAVLVGEVSVVPDALMQRRFSFLRRVALDPLSTAIGAAAGIAGTAAGLHVWGLVIGVYAALGTQAVLSWAFAAWRPQFRLVSFGMWRELASYGRHILVASGLQRVSLEGRTALVGHWLGAAPLGQYTLAFRLGAQPRALLVNGVSYVLMPALAHVSDDPERFRRAALRGMQSVFLAAVPLNLLLVPFARPATVLLFGSTWATAGTAIAWMSGYGIIGAADSVASEVSKAARRPEWLPRMHAVRTIAVLALTGAFLNWGVSGAAFALTAGELVAAALCLRAFVSVTGAGHREIFARLATPAVAGCALLAASVPLRLAFDPSGYGELVGLVVLAAEALAGACAYLVVVAVLDPPAARRAVALVRRALGRVGATEPAADAPVAPS